MFSDSPENHSAIIFADTACHKTLKVVWRRREEKETMIPIHSFNQKHGFHSQPGFSDL